MKIAVHIYFEERQHYCPAMSEFRSIPSEIQLSAQTENQRKVPGILLFLQKDQLCYLKRAEKLTFCIYFS